MYTFIWEDKFKFTNSIAFFWMASFNFLKSKQDPDKEVDTQGSVYKMRFDGGN